MESDGDEGAADAGCECKVGRIASRYSLDGLDDELVGRWLGENGDRQSLRDLESYVNRQVLAAAMDGADLEVLAGEVENVYRLLTDDGASEGQRTETRNRLERSGIDVGAVESSFLSHQTIHTHLRDCLDAKRKSETTTPRERREQALETVASLRNRTEAVVETSLRQLVEADALTPEEFDVIVDVSVTCGRCGRVHSVSDLVQEGGCGCS